MTKNLEFKVVLVFIIYVLLRFFGGNIGSIILYPINLLVTFLHEFGHAVGGVLTGGKITGLQINTDGSGYTSISGGNAAITLISGYVGSMFFGNLLFYIGARIEKFHRFTMALLGGLMFFVGLFWFNSIFSTIILFIYGYILYFLATRSEWPGTALLFFGLASILYIIQDINVGPTSDLEQFAHTLGILSTSQWRIVWWIIVVFMFIYNLGRVFNKNYFKKVF
jgi:Peptidase M50B-like